VRQLFHYLYVGRFSKRKNAVVTFSMQLDIDAPFEFQRLVGYIVGESIPFTITIPQLSTFPQLAGDTPLWPAALLDAGGSVSCVASLLPGVDIGRRRPQFIVEFRGCKLYGDGKEPANTVLIGQQRTA
jgi:hypothetical protein